MHIANRYPYYFTNAKKLSNVQEPLKFCLKSCSCTLPKTKNKTFANKIGQRRRHLKKKLSKNCNENCSRKKVPKFSNLAKNAIQFFWKHTLLAVCMLLQLLFKVFSRRSFSKSRNHDWALATSLFWKKLIYQK